ncbi:MAG: hypothetical protein JJT96_15045 [Opitutales bacterium]|nr:hypothetical protein [Opitutales bacterium]
MHSFSINRGTPAPRAALVFEAGREHAGQRIPVNRLAEVFEGRLAPGDPRLQLHPVEQSRILLLFKSHTD